MLAVAAPVVLLAAAATAVVTLTGHPRSCGDVALTTPPNVRSSTAPEPGATAAAIQCFVYAAARQADGSCVAAMLHSHWNGTGLVAQFSDDRFEVRADCSVEHVFSNGPGGSDGTEECAVLGDDGTRLLLACVHPGPGASAELDRLTLTGSGPAAGIEQG